MIEAKLRKAERCIKQGKLAAARQLYQGILQQHPKNPTALQGMRSLQQQMIHVNSPPPEQLQVIVDCYHKAQYQLGLQQGHALLQHYPHSANLHNVIGALQTRVGQAQQAVASYRQAIKLAPDYADAHNNCGVILIEMGHRQAALECFSRAVEIKPDYESAHFNKSLILLIYGDFANGWKEYEWRLYGSKNKTKTKGFTEPIWLGDSDIAGKTILIHTEQGFGDAIQFSRYVKRVADLGATVIFEVRAKLVPLLEPFKAYAELVVKGEPRPAYDIQCPLLSLPLAFGTELDSIPDEVDYLYVSPQHIDYWQTRLGQRTKPRIGIAWSGSPKNSYNKTRNIPLATLLKYLPADYEYISLHHEARPEDQPALDQIRHFGDELSGFDTTAGLCKNLDLIISVDTSLAHLGGALNLPTWVLLAHPFDFRWLLDRSDSPWYPSIRLFRQSTPGDWPGVLTEVARALSEHPL